MPNSIDSSGTGANNSISEEITNAGAGSSGRRHIPYEDIHFVDSTKPVWNYSLFDEEDIRNFQNGTHYRLYELFGSHQRTVLERSGYYFAVWAPNATYVSVIGNF